MNRRGMRRLKYGSDLLNRLSKDMKERYGKGFSHSNVVYMRKLYLAYPKGQTLSDFLTWSHYVELLKIDDVMAEESLIINIRETVSPQLRSCGGI